MNAAQFIGEGLRVARPSLLLRARPREKRPDGFWGGDGVVPLSGAGRHWISVDCTWLAQHGVPVRGCLSLYEQGPLRFTAVHDETAAMPATQSGGIPLFGQEEPSIPPSEALDLCGSVKARDWFAKIAAGGSAARRAPAIAEAYDSEYQRRCPLWHDDVFAVLGGWHTFWPDSDDYNAQSGRLVLWTFRNAEPWVEVWAEESGALRVVPRIT